jgi:predicted MPP superfamily phosphohydrolase
MKNSVTRTLVGAAAAGTLAAGVLAALYAWYGERARVQLDRFTVSVDKGGLPPGGLTILHISDLHLRATDRMQTAKLARLQQLLSGERYDLVALTGDLIHDDAGFVAALTFIDTLQPRLATFFVPGNHDYCESSLWGIIDASSDDGAHSQPGGQSPGSALRKTREIVNGFREFGRKLLVNERVHLPICYHDVAAMNRELERHHVQPLVNASTHMQGDGLDLWVAGVDDLWEGHPDPGAALAEVPYDALLLMLAHNPDAWLEPGMERADLVLSGHVHGGQVRLPVLGALHTQGTHLTRRQADGWFRRNGSQMFVSRGVGESLPLRFGVLPQVTLIRLKAVGPNGK